MPDHIDKISRCDQIKGQILKGWEAAYPIGAVARTLKDVEDPINNVSLPAGSYVTIEHRTFRGDLRLGLSWILCEDQNKQKWNIRPLCLSLVPKSVEKVGRFRILAQNSIIEQILKES